MDRDEDSVSSPWPPGAPQGHPRSTPGPQATPILTTQVINRVATTFKPQQDEATVQQEVAQILEAQRRDKLEQLARDNGSRAVDIAGVVVEGTEQYRDAFIAKQIEPFIKDSSNFSKVLQNIDKVTENFFKTTAVAGVQISLDSGASRGSSMEIVPLVKITPVKKFVAQTGTNIGNGEGDGYMKFQWRNIFGGGENVMIDCTTGTRTRSSYLFNYSEPFANKPNWRNDLTMFMTSRNIDWCSHEQLINGLNLRLSSNNDTLNHEFVFENLLRSITNVGLNASNNVLFHAGDDLKSSIIYKLKLDTRDSKILPKSGFNFEVNSELSGLFPQLNTSRFVKQSVETSLATHSPVLNTILNLNLKGGWLYSLNSKSINLMDKFYIGGPNDVRSFFYNGIGPRNNLDSLGGDCFVSGGLSVFNKFPFVKSESFKIHTFVNFGKLLPYDKNESLNTNLKELLSKPAVGAGIGMVYLHPIARFELNFVLPISSHQNDSIRKGFQYGVGISFL